jgi:hypothetical protein
MALHEEGTFKGKPTLTLKRTEDDKYAVTFGVSKLALILENIEIVKEFVAKNTKK